MEPQDILARRIADYVATQVPLQQREVVTRTVCMVVATLMADPTFTEELVIVKALRNENQWLRTNYQILKGVVDQSMRSQPRKRAAKKSTAKRPAGPSTSRGSTASQQRPKRSAPNSSFRQGFEEMRG